MMTNFNLDACKQSEFYPKMRELVMLLVEARDALPAISLASAKLHNVSLDLDKRIEAAIEPWRVP